MTIPKIRREAFEIQFFRNDESEREIGTKTAERFLKVRFFEHLNVSLGIEIQAWARLQIQADGKLYPLIVFEQSKRPTSLEQFLGHGRYGNNNCRNRGGVKSISSIGRGEKFERRSYSWLRSCLYDLETDPKSQGATKKSD